MTLYNVLTNDFGRCVRRLLAGGLSTDPAVVGLISRGEGEGSLGLGLTLSRRKPSDSRLLSFLIRLSLRMLVSLWIRLDGAVCV